MKFYGLLCILATGLASEDFSEHHHAFENDPVPEQVEGRIYHGEEVNSTIECPYVVSIVTDFNDFSYRNKRFCSGTIISVYYILATKECLHVYNPSNSEVRTGDVRRREGIVIPIAGWSQFETLHDPFDGRIHVDIGYMKTESPIPFDDFIQPIVLASDGLPDSVTIYGWGTHSDRGGELSPILRTTELEFVPIEVCRAVYERRGNKLFPRTINEFKFCAENTRDENVGGCYGDYGAPAVYDSRLYGIFTFAGEDCGQYVLPSVFTYLQNPLIRDFITGGTGVEYEAD